MIGRKQLSSLFLDIQSSLSKDDVKEYTEKIISDTNIGSVYDIIKKIHNSNNNVNYYKTILYLLCTEAISISEANSYLDTPKEYFIYFLLSVEFNRLRGFIINRDKKVADYIPDLYYGSSTHMSYKDIENIVNELIHIIDNTSDISFSDICSYTDKRDIAIYLINNYIKINGDFINLSYTNGEYVVGSSITTPEVWSLLPKISFYLNNNTEIDSELTAENAVLDVDIEPDIEKPVDFNFDNIKSRYIDNNSEAKQIAKLLPIILERTINYNEV